MCCSPGWILHTLKELCTTSGHQQAFQWGMLNKPLKMLNKSSSSPPKSECLVLEPKKLCSFKKPWDVVMKQQESLAVLLGHISGTQVTGMRNPQHRNASWQDGWWHVSRDPTLNGLNMQQGSDWGKDPDGGNSCWHEAQPRQESPSGILPPFSATSTWVMLEYDIQSSARVNSEFLFIWNSSRNCNWGCVRWTNQVCPYLIPGNGSWAVRRARGLPPLLDMEHMHSWTKHHNAVVEHSVSMGWEAKQAGILTLRSQEKDIHLYLIQAWPSSEVAAHHQRVGGDVDNVCVSA